MCRFESGPTYSIPERKDGVGVFMGTSLFLFGCFVGYVVGSRRSEPPPPGGLSFSERALKSMKDERKKEGP